MLSHSTLWKKLPAAKRLSNLTNPNVVPPSTGKTLDQNSTSVLPDHFINSTNALQFLLLWQRFCSHCYMSLAPQVPWEATDRPDSLFFHGSGNLCPVCVVEGKLLQWTWPLLAEGSSHMQGCRKPRSCIMLFLSEGTAANSHFVGFFCCCFWGFFAFRMLKIPSRRPKEVHWYGWPRK